MRGQGNVNYGDDGESRSYSTQIDPFFKFTILTTRNSLFRFSPGKGGRISVLWDRKGKRKGGEPPQWGRSVRVAVGSVGWAYGPIKREVDLEDKLR